MNIADLKVQQLIVFECISGSHAYGLNLPESDLDIKGVFVLPPEKFFGLTEVPQVSDERNDTTYFEIGRFFELLGKSNPTALELLFTPAESIRYQHPLFTQLPRKLFLSKKCRDTFAGYARMQIKKARGLNKKILNPFPKEKKDILDFCHVAEEGKSVALRSWLEKHGLRQEDCGLAKLDHMRDLFACYHDASGQYGYKGMLRKPHATRLLLSSIPKDELPIAYLSFNEDGYTKYCKDYQQYWEWVEKRNEARYEGTIAHGKNYDAKNMMHTFRLLDMAIEILADGELHLKRPNRDELLAIRKGKFQYEELLDLAEKKLEAVENAWANSILPETPPADQIEALLIDFRKSWYVGQ
ncbi:MAG: nucleotidyltransferase domain-containing protein [Bacteroidota bacterium]